MSSLASQLQLIAAGFGFMSALFFALGALTTKSQDIVDLASTYWDYNESLQITLTVQRADYLVGALLLLVTFLLQISAIMSNSSAVVFGSAWSVPMAAISVGMLLALSLRKLVIHLTAKRVDVIRASQMDDDT